MDNLDSTVQGINNNAVALEILNKVKPLTLVEWNGEQWASTDMLAEYFESPFSTIYDSIKTHIIGFNSEFDGKILKKKDYSMYGFIRSATEQGVVLLDRPKAQELYILPPRAILRLANKLKVSPVAKAIRSQIAFENRKRSEKLLNELLTPKEETIIQPELKLDKTADRDYITGIITNVSASYRNRSAGTEININVQYFLCADDPDYEEKKTIINTIAIPCNEVRISKNEQ